jgi:hypothetical protein
MVYLLVVKMTNITMRLKNQLYVYLVFNYKNHNLFRTNIIHPLEVHPCIVGEDFKSGTNDEEAVASEIAATARSLQTNLIFSLVDIFILLLMVKFSDTIIVLAVSTLKGLVLILTTISNFGTIQNVLALYWQNLVLHFLE